MIAALDYRSGRVRLIVKAKSTRIIISNFAIIVCCEKMKQYLKDLRKKSQKMKIQWTHDNVQCESADKMYGRRFD